MLENGLYLINGARLIFRNFRGEERQFNDAGDRNFNLVLTEEQADECRAIGFNVRTRPARNEEDPPQHLLPVAVSYKNRAPKIMLIVNGRKTSLNEATVGELDYADFDHVDLSIRPYRWSIPGGASGVKAYLNSGYFTIASDGFEDKYGDTPMAEPSDEDVLPF